jgi:hypothetical protein
MSMQPALRPEPDPQIAAAIRAMYGFQKAERLLAVEVRDRLGQWLALRISPPRVAADREADRPAGG